MTRLVTGSILVFVSLGVLGGCAQPEDGRSTDTAELAAVDAVVDSFGRAVLEQDPERFSELFTVDATYASNDGQLWQSREEILEGARQWMRVPQVPSRTRVKAEVVGNVAYVFEEYSSDVQFPERPPQTVTGRSLAVLRLQEDGSWKIDALVVNRDPAR